MNEVTVEVVDHVAMITLRGPGRVCTFTDRKEADLVAAFERCDADDDVRAVVLTGGGGGTAFCAGMDLSDGERAFRTWRRGPAAPAGTGPDPATDLPIRRDGGGRVSLQIFECRKPVIAAINGDAIGVGITMTLAADIRLTLERARIGFVFNRRGFVPEGCSSWFLPRVIPMSHAMDLVLTGRMIDGVEAQRIGLVSRACATEAELREAAGRLAADIARSTAPVSNAVTRRMMWRMLGADHPMTAHRLETVALNLRGVSTDAAEGIRAFFERRPPRFTDRVSTDMPPIGEHLPTPTFTLPEPIGSADAER